MLHYIYQASYERIILPDSAAHENKKSAHELDNML
jgi:hypothetical protein